MRKQETEGRKGKQADGSAKTREVKLAVLLIRGNPFGTVAQSPTMLLLRVRLPEILMENFQILPPG